MADLVSVREELEADFRTTRYKKTWDVFLEEFCMRHSLIIQEINAAFYAEIQRMRSIEEDV